MGHDQAAQVLLHEAFIQITVSLAKRIVLITSEDKDLTGTEGPDSVSEGLIISLHLALKHHLSVARELATHVRVFALVNRSGHVVALRHGLSVESLLHDLLLHISCFAHEGSCLALDHSKLVHLLVFDE